MSLEKCLNLTGGLLYTLEEQDFIYEINNLQLHKTWKKNVKTAAKNIVANKVVMFPKLQEKK